MSPHLKETGAVSWNDRIVKYNPALKQLARELRNNSTKSEIQFWNAVKTKQFKGLDFHRQKPIGNFIADFYCPAINLVVELDGKSHFEEEVIAKDREKAQLTYQDPLKPMDNFQFVSQLAQFSQIQQGQVMTDKLGALVTSQTTFQATSLLGRQVDLPTNNSGSVISGTVKAISFQNGDPRLTIQTSDGQTISNISPSAISQVR